MYNKGIHWDFTGWLIITILALVVIIGLIIVLSDNLYLITDALPFIG